ncbi:MAG: response regulator [Thainema sp.]
MRILLVSPNQSLQNILHQDLSRHHLIIDPADDGKEAWELLQAFMYDLVLLEATLPKLDDISLCHRLRDVGNPVLILPMIDTSTSRDRVQALEAGADACVEKPIQQPELLAYIRALALFLFSRLVSPTLSTWTVLLPMLLFGAGYSIANVPRMNSLLSSAPPALAGVASETNNAIAQIGNAMGIAVTVALVTTFGRNYYFGELHAAGLNEQQINQATDLLKKVLSSDAPSIASQFAIPVEQLEGLVGNYQAAFTTGVTQMFLMVAIALILAAFIIWFRFSTNNKSA